MTDASLINIVVAVAVTLAACAVLVWLFAAPAPKSKSRGLGMMIGSIGYYFFGNRGDGGSDGGES